MDVQFYNTRSRAKERFEPRLSGQATLYACGPTVYRYVHIGNLRTFLMADLVRRLLDYAGYRVTQVMNITDVGHMAEDDSLTITPGEDKVLAAAAAEKKTPQEIAAYYTADFLEAVRQMNILPAHHYPHATDHIPQMLEVIGQLVAKGLAYEKNGAVFYDVSRFPGYGQLSGHALADLQAGISRVAIDETKDDPNDFLLWRTAGERRAVKWDSPWGPGFPGWHIECSAMAMHYLGPQLDLHTGGEDLVFPHHEGEIAQSEGMTGQPFVRYWLHGAHLLAEGRKMARSAGNILRLPDLRAQGIEPLAFRLLCLGLYYRSHMNVTWESLKAAQTNLDKLRRYVAGWAPAPRATTLSPLAADYAQRFTSAAAEDLGFPQALPILWEMAKSDLAPGEKLALLLDWDRLLGLNLTPAISPTAPAPSPDAQALLDQRAAARAAQDWAAADRLRDQLAEHGLIVKDTKAGQTWALKNP
jgi:cysteinyl-tRNA synthetase